MNFPKERGNDYSKMAIEARLKFLSQHPSSSCSSWNENSLGCSCLDPEMSKGNIEYMIGFSQVPVGLMGPIQVNGEFAKGDFYVPLSCTEGALVSSYNRGAKVISMSGGANVILTRDSIQRAPLFILENIFQARDFIKWFELNFSILQKVADSTTQHGHLLSFETYIQGNLVYVRLDFFTGDAMGMNMVTKASLALCEYVKNNFPIKSYVIESNMAVDKKPSFMNSLRGRGKSLSAEVLIKEKVLSKFLRVKARDVEITYKQQVLGNLMAGVLGCNYHFANGIAAIFLACGQDLANVSESCLGYTYMEAREEDLYVSISLPSLIVGTVGGGVSLATQKESLKIMDCHGPGKAKKFAEIVAASILAGEISLACSIVAGDFVSAHEKFGRNRPHLS